MKKDNECYAITGIDFLGYEKKRKLSKATYGFNRGQHELIIQISKKLRKLEKRYGVI